MASELIDRVALALVNVERREHSLAPVGLDALTKADAAKYRARAVAVNDALDRPAPVEADQRCPVCHVKFRKIADVDAHIDRLVHSAPKDAVEAETYRQMHDIAVNDLGYPSILEALEAAPHAGAPKDAGMTTVGVPMPNAQQFVATINGRSGLEISSVSELLRLINGGARFEALSATPSFTDPVPAEK